VPPPHGLGSRVEWRGLFKLCLSDVWPCQFNIPAGSPVDLVRTGTHGPRALVPPPYGLGRGIEWRGLLKLRLSGVWLFRFDLFIRAGAHGSRTGLPPPVLTAGHANRAESQHDRRAKTENEMFHRCVTSMRSSGPPLENWIGSWRRSGIFPMWQDVSQHFSAELSQVAEEECPRNPLGRRHSIQFGTIRRNRRAQDQVKTCIPFAVKSRGGLRVTYVIGPHFTDNGLPSPEKNLPKIGVALPGVWGSLYPSPSGVPWHPTGAERIWEEFSTALAHKYEMRGKVLENLENHSGLAGHFASH